MVAEIRGAATHGGVLRIVTMSCGIISIITVRNNILIGGRGVGGGRSLERLKRRCWGSAFLVGGGESAGGGSGEVF